MASPSQEIVTLPPVTGYVNGPVVSASVVVVVDSGDVVEVVVDDGAVVEVVVLDPADVVVVVSDDVLVEVVDGELVEVLLDGSVVPTVGSVMVEDGAETEEADDAVASSASSATAWVVVTNTADGWSTTFAPTSETAVIEMRTATTVAASQPTTKPTRRVTSTGSQTPRQLAVREG